MLIRLRVSGLHRAYRHKPVCASIYVAVAFIDARGYHGVEDHNSMDYLAVIGLILQGISFWLQTKKTNRNDLAKNIYPLINELNRAKSIHNFSERMVYTIVNDKSLKPATTIEARFSRDDLANARNEYEHEKKQNNIHYWVFSDPPELSFRRIDDELHSVVATLKIDRQLSNLNRSFPTMMKKAEVICNSYETYLSDLERAEEKKAQDTLGFLKRADLPTVLRNADESMKMLIEILERMITASYA